MLKIPSAYQQAVKVKVTETIECTCQRCGPEPKVWRPKEMQFTDDGTVQLPQLCPRCHSAVWWEPVKRPSMADWQRDNQAKKRAKKKESRASVQALDNTAADVAETIAAEEAYGSQP
jgi:hypothetical protein